MNRKRLSALLSLLLILSLFAGCAGSQESAAHPQESASGEAGAQQSQEDAAPPAASTGEAPLEIRMTCRLFDSVPDMENAFWTEYQRLTNTKLDIEWIPDGDYNTKLNLIFAGGDLPEVLVADLSNNRNNPPFINAVRNGAFWELTDVLGDFSSYPNLRDNQPPNVWVYARTLGKTYGIPRSEPQFSGTPLMRKDLLDDLGLDMPTTIDEFADVLEAVVQANPGMIGLVSKQDMFINSSGGLAFAFGAAETYFNDEGGLIYMKLNPGFTDFVEWLRDFYSRGLLSEEFSVMKPTQSTELFQSGAAVCLTNESMRWAYPFTQTLLQVKDDAYVESVVPLQGPAGAAISLSAGFTDQFFISSQVPEEKMLKILDYFELTCSDEYFELNTYGLEGIHYNMEDGVKVLTEQQAIDMGSSAPWQVLPRRYDPYMKVGSPAAPPEYNQQQRDYFDSWNILEVGTLDPFSVITSDAWIDEWPKFESEWASMAVKAVTSQISMDEYKAYVDTINENPQIRAAYLEYAANYKKTFGG